MCGIFGYFLPSNEARPNLALAQENLKHRGPDDRGTFEAKTRDYACGLAHTRLSILDLSAAGHQPMATPDGRYTVTYNGEIYNFAELRRNLEVRGAVFHSHTDTEALLLAYEHWGADCVSRLHGMFAFAIWDEPKRRLILARDRLGVKPLYYVKPPTGGIVFASEVRTLLATGYAERKLSPTALETYLTYGSVREPDTILRNVHALLPGHTLEIDDSGSRTHCYWHLPPETNREVDASWAIERTRALLQRSVDLRLVADVPVGVFLSGGIDSSAIVALASRHATQPIYTFTLSFDEAAWDERHFARYVAERFGCRHHDVLLPGQRALLEIDSALGALDQPSTDGINSYFVSKAAREAGLVVALSGLGADEVFAGYSYFRAFNHMWRARRLIRAMDTSLGGLARMASRNSSQALRKLVSISGATDIGAFYGAIRAMFTPPQVEELIARGFRRPANSDDALLQLQLALENGRTDPVQAWSAMELSIYLRNTLLRDTDAMSMAHGLEVREPFLDHLLVEHVVSLPAKLKLASRAPKPHLVAAVPELPAAITGRRKMGFALPFDVWLRGPLKQWAEERLLGGIVSRAGCIDAGVVEKMWQGFLVDGTRVTHSRVWCLLALLDWMGRHGVQA
jgi:asparagine synthase (glutamine-hydrolysing)